MIMQLELFVIRKLIQAYVVLGKGWTEKKDENLKFLNV